MVTESRIKLILEVSALAVGLILGIVSLWQQFRPSNDLIAEILITPARIPPSLAKTFKSLPSDVAKSFKENESVKKLIPSHLLCNSIAKALTPILGVYSDQWLNEDSLHAFDNLIYCKVTNKGTSTLKDIQINNLLGSNNYSMFVISQDGTEKIVDYKGSINLGDLRPQSSLQIFTWNFIGFIFPNASISHSNGVGEIHNFYLDSLWNNNGIFIPYYNIKKFFAILLIALSLIVIVIIFRKRSISPSI